MKPGRTVISRKKKPIGRSERIPKRVNRNDLGKRLGLSLENPSSLINEIQGGLRIAVIEDFARVLDISTQRLARGVVISERTIARRKTEGRLHADESDRVARLALLFSDAVNLFEGDFGRAAAWFHTHNTALGGKTPFEYADTEPGTQEVRDLIARIEHGVFS